MSPHGRHAATIAQPYPLPRMCVVCEFNARRRLHSEIAGCVGDDAGHVTGRITPAIGLSSVRKHRHWQLLEVPGVPAADKPVRSKDTEYRTAARWRSYAALCTSSCSACRRGWRLQLACKKGPSVGVLCSACPCSFLAPQNNGRAALTEVTAVPAIRGGAVVRE